MILKTGGSGFSFSLVGKHTGATRDRKSLQQRAGIPRVFFLAEVCLDLGEVYSTSCVSVYLKGTT